MKKLIAVVIIGLMVLPAFSFNGGGENPKPVLKNYKEVLSQVKYPTVCRTNGIEGTVKVKITVDQNGEMKAYKILEYPCSDLKKAVEEALPNLQFEPAYQDGKAVMSKIVVPINFQLTL